MALTSYGAGFEGFVLSMARGLFIQKKSKNKIRPSFIYLFFLSSSFPLFLSPAMLVFNRVILDPGLGSEELGEHRLMKPTRSVKFSVEQLCLLLLSCVLTEADLGWPHLLWHAGAAVDAWTSVCRELILVV